MTALQIVAYLVALALVATGAAGLGAPRAAARWYGLPAEGDGAHGFVRAAALRDLAIGVVLAAAAYFHDVAVTIVVAIAGIALALGDFAIAYHASGQRVRREHASHLAGAAAFVLVLAMALLAVGI